jgi:hypothetical protein
LRIFLVQLRRVLILERQISRNHSEQHYTAAPDIAERRNVVLPSDHLWGRVAWGAARSLQQTTFWVDVAEAEISDLDILVLVQEQILRLHISVHHVHRMYLFHPRDDLVEEAARIAFWKPLV